VGESAALRGSRFWITIPRRREGAAVEEPATACR
jgi:hypothetical protein